MDEARVAIERHAEAVNVREPDGYRRTMNFPFTYQNYNGVALTMASEAECGTSEPFPWEIIERTDPDWSHSVFDVIEEVARSVSSAVYKVSFRRIDRAGNASPPYDAVWIATLRDGHWGVQFRHNLGVRNVAP